jgi:hypothetical protein
MEDSSVLFRFQEYVKGISSTGMQSNCGFEGQVNACWTHKMTTKELDTIRSAGFLISVIHGRLVWPTADILFREWYMPISLYLHHINAGTISLHNCVTQNV